MTPEPRSVDRASSEAARTALLALSAAIFMVNLDSRAIVPILPAIAGELGLSTARVGVLVSAYLLPYGFFQLAYGPLADRFGKLRICTAAMLVFSVGTALCGAGRSFEVMVAFRVLTGMAAAAIFPLAFAGDSVPYERRQATIAGLMASAGAAQAFGTSAGGLIAAAVSWRTVFPVIGGLGGAAAAWLFWQARGEQAAALGAVARRAPYADVLRAPGYASLLALVAVEGFLFAGGFPFLSGLLESRFRTGALRAGVALGLAGVAQLVAARLLPRIIGRLGERGLVVAGGSLVGAAFVTSACAPSWVVVGLACATMGFGFTLCHTTLQTRATEAYPKARGSALALFAFSLFLGSGIGATAYAAAVERAGYAITFAAAGGAFWIFTVVTLLRLRARPTSSR